MPLDIKVGSLVELKNNMLVVVRNLQLQELVQMSNSSVIVVGGLLCWIGRQQKEG